MKKHYRNFFLATISACLIYFSSRFNISIPGTDVPQSAQTLVILITVALLPSFFGLVAVSLYLIAGLIGLPVFSNGGFGLKHFLGATGVYLFGFLIAAAFIDLCKRNINIFNFYQNLIVMLLAHIIILFFGWLCLSKSIGPQTAYLKGVHPFILGGIVKSVLATIIVCALFNLFVLSKNKP